MKRRSKYFRLFFGLAIFFLICVFQWSTSDEDYILHTHGCAAAPNACSVVSTLGWLEVYNGSIYRMMILITDGSSEWGPYVLTGSQTAPLRIDLEENLYIIEVWFMTPSLPGLEGDWVCFDAYALGVVAAETSTLHVKTPIGYIPTPK